MFKKEVYDIVRLSLLENGYAESHDFFGDAVSKTKFAIMRKDGVNPEAKIRKAIADKFCDYIFSLC